MKLKEAKKSYDQLVLVAVDITPNPDAGMKGDWLLLMKERSGKSHFLVTDDEDVQSFPSIEDAINTLKVIGFKRAKIFF